MMTQAFAAGVIHGFSGEGVSAGVSAGVRNFFMLYPGAVGVAIVWRMWWKCLKIMIHGCLSIYISLHRARTYTFIVDVFVSSCDVIRVYVRFLTLAFMVRLFQLFSSFGRWSKNSILYFGEMILRGSDQLCQRHGSDEAFVMCPRNGSRGRSNCSSLVRCTWGRVVLKMDSLKIYEMKVNI